MSTAPKTDGYSERSVEFRSLFPRLTMKINWHTRWFETEEEAKAFVNAIWNQAWGVELRRVNSANKTYDHGYTVRWYWRKETEK